jgi:hypothetical protein
MKTKAESISESIACINKADLCLSDALSELWLLEDSRFQPPLLEIKRALSGIVDQLFEAKFKCD